MNSVCRALRRLLVVACAAAVVGAPGVASAHGFGQRFDLPLPLWLWITGAGATIVLTFVVMALFFRETDADSERYPTLALPSVPGRANVPDRERFLPGDAVRVRDDAIPGHVRMPAYVRGRTGVVVRETPAYPFPDAHAHGVEADDEPTFDVRFRSTDLWPNTVDEAFVHVGVFQSYLERA